MKTYRFLILALVAGILSFTACDPASKTVQDSSVNLPDKFSVDMPSSISDGNGKKMAAGDTLSGGDLYQHLRTFINIGDFSSNFVEDIIKAINKFNLAQSMNITYVSDDDGRTKSLVVVENATFEGTQYNFGLTVKDSNDIAMQVYWNNDPVKGTAIVSPYNFDRTTNEKYSETKYRVDYSEAGDMGYENHMIVSISDYPLEDKFGLDNLKMFVGKNGDNIDIYGNSNHPEMWLYTDAKVGYDWAFVSRANITSNIAVAKVALPPMELTTTDSIFEKYNFKEIISEEIHRIYDGQFDPSLVDQFLQGYLKNAEQPAYFDATGFIAAGPDNQPSNFSNDFVDLSNLTPYVPNDIRQLEVKFYVDGTAK